MAVCVATVAMACGSPEIRPDDTASPSAAPDAAPDAAPQDPGPTRPGGPTPDMADEPCDKVSGYLRYAVHRYPGVAASELYDVIAVATHAPSLVAMVDGVAFQKTVATGMIVADGAVAVPCDAYGGVGSVVTFVRR